MSDFDVSTRMFEEVEINAGRQNVITLVSQEVREVDEDELMPLHVGGLAWLTKRPVVFTRCC